MGARRRSILSLPFRNSFSSLTAADGVSGGADGMVEGEYGSSAWSVLLGEGVFVVLGLHGPVVEAVYAVIVVVPGAAEAEPDDVPFVAVAKDAWACWGIEWPV